MDDIKTLMDMGFDKERAQYALEVTNQKGVEPAMEWLLAHIDEEIPKNAANMPKDSATEAVSNNSESVSGAGAPNVTDASGTMVAPSASTSPCSDNGGEVKSLRCDDCGKVFRQASEAEFHATKSGHLNFSESSEEKKPLTEEEKKEQMVLIEQKLKQKRLEREEREKADELERERNRIRSGKDMTEARRRIEEMEMKKIVEQRKREKAEEKAARDRVRAQIEADKAARKARENVATTSATSATSTTAKTTPIAVNDEAVAKIPAREYTETRLQIRLWDGSTITETFNIKEQLSAVRVFIQMKTDIDGAFTLMTPFPRKLFNSDDYEKPLDALGLVPSAVLVITKTG